jgi:hypothetical protein
MDWDRVNFVKGDEVTPIGKASSQDAWQSFLDGRARQRSDQRVDRGLAVTRSEAWRGLRGPYPSSALLAAAVSQT